ncbi:alpha/beta hydrolase, partial [Ralstonia pseudosolanacearum]|uniref:alpha/beta hydrolase n=1 Tax=Ralstonia pseudosolanacearum TaxID=1310165 RepID=UPI003CE88F63
MTRTAAQTAIAAHGRHWPAGVAMLTVPGLYGSGPGHWQSRWEERFPDWRRVEQDDWSTPDLARLVRSGRLDRCGATVLCDVAAGHG